MGVNRQNCWEVKRCDLPQWTPGMPAIGIERARVVQTDGWYVLTLTNVCYMS